MLAALPAYGGRRLDSGGGGAGDDCDVAVLWPPDAAPIVVAIMSNRRDRDAEHDDALVAEAATLIADELGEP